jgi:uncharacterized membrane protein
MEDMILLALVGLASLVTSIVVASQFSKLKWSVEQLKARIFKLEEQRESRAAEAKPSRGVTPPPLPAFLQRPPPTPAAPSQTQVPKPLPPSINWESILGVKLFAWIGGFAFFLGVVFFVKYAFDNNLITPLMRIVGGAIVGTLLIVIAVFPAVRRYRVPAQSLCATGVLILYADIYAAYSFYDLIPLTSTSLLMWIVTVAALLLAAGANAQSAAWLGLIGGFATPFLLRAKTPPDLGVAHWPQSGPLIFLITYVVVLDCAVAFVSAAKQWTILLTAAALASFAVAVAWVYGVFDPYYPYLYQHFFFISVEAIFLVLCSIVAWRQSLDNWTIAAIGIAGVGALIGMPMGRSIMNDQDMTPWILCASAGIIAFATIHRRFQDSARAMAMLVGLALALTCFFEWHWCKDVLFYRFTPWDFVDGDRAAMEASRHLWLVVFRHVAIFILYAATPYLVGTKRLWPWLIAAVAGIVHFFFVYAYLKSPAGLVRHDLLWILPIVFALPASFSVWYLVRKEHVELASGDARLASQGAAVLTFVSLIFPVQFEREWITLGWAIEGLALILLFRWIPNRRLRAVALIVLAAAFVRLALNPAVLHYHPRSHVPIFNWYLYAYGVAAICFGLSAFCFGQPREKKYERRAAVILYSLAAVTLFLLMNIEIADYFSIGPTLTFSFSGNFARDMTYTIAWAMFAFGLLVIGISSKTRAARFAAIGLLCFTLAKLFLHDLDSLNQLYRIAAFITVAIIAIVASFAYQRFLTPGTKVP